MTSERDDDAARASGEFLRDFLRRNSVPLVDTEEIMSAISEVVDHDGEHPAS